MKRRDGDFIEKAFKGGPVENGLIAFGVGG